MDARSETREFLTSGRAKLTPDQAGLRTYGTGARRVPGLRSKSEEALNLLASWTATLDLEETANVTEGA